MLRLLLYLNLLFWLFNLIPMISSNISMLKTRRYIFPVRTLPSRFRQLTDIVTHADGHFKWTSAELLIAPIFPKLRPALGSPALIMATSSFQLLGSNWSPLDSSPSYTACTLRKPSFKIYKINALAHYCHSCHPLTNHQHLSPGLLHHTLPSLLGSSVVF